MLDQQIRSPSDQRVSTTSIRELAAFGQSAAVELPDISGEFRSELAALLSFFARRIAAARTGVSAADVSAIIQALINEQNAAVRALTNRWQAATRQQRDAQQAVQGSKPSRG